MGAGGVDMAVVAATVSGAGTAIPALHCSSFGAGDLAIASGSAVFSAGTATFGPVLIARKPRARCGRAGATGFPAGFCHRTSTSFAAAKPYGFGKRWALFGLERIR